MFIIFYLIKESQTSFPNYSELIKQGKIGKENNIMGSLGNNGSASKPVKLSAKHSGSINLDNDNTKIDRLDKGEKPSMNKNLEVNAMSSTTNSNIAPNTTKNINAPTLKNNKDEPISIMSLLGAQNYVPLDVNHINVKFDKYDQPKVSSKTLTDIRAYAANTNQGIVRYLNMSLILK